MFSIIILPMDDDFELSEREIDIIRLVATGASNKEIAQKLVISPNTVKVHLRNIFGKLNVVSRTEATMTAIRMGWVDSPKNETLMAEADATSAVIAQPENIPQTTNRRVWLAGIGLAALMLVMGIVYFAFFDRNGPPLGESTPEPSQLQSASRWEMLSPLPQQLKSMTAVRYDQSFFVFGGENGGGINDSVLVYDTANDAWTTARPKPLPVSQTQAAIFGEQIYIPGGLMAGGGITDILEVYDPRDDSWDQKAKLPYKISRYAFVSFEGKLYLFGGWDGASYRDEILEYDPNLDAWKVLAEMPQARADFTAAVLGGGIHLFGGRNEKGALADHDIFIPQRLAAGEEAWQESNPLPQPRYGMGICVLAEMVYILGGENDEDDDLPLVQYMLPRDEWLEIEQPEEKIGAFAAVIPYETRLYVLGGEVDAQLKSTHQVFQAIYTILVPVVR